MLIRYAICDVQAKSLPCHRLYLSSRLDGYHVISGASYIHHLTYIQPTGSEQQHLA